MLHKQNRMPLAIDTDNRVETFHIKSNVDVKQDLLIEDGSASTHAGVPFVSENRSYLLKNKMPLPIDQGCIDTTFHIKTNVDVEDGRALTHATICLDLDMVPECMCHGFNNRAYSLPILKSFETISPGWTNGRVVIKRKKLSTIFTSAPRNFIIDFFIVLIVIIITVSVVIFIVIVIMSPRHTVSDFNATTLSSN